MNFRTMKLSKMKISATIKSQENLKGLKIMTKIKNRFGLVCFSNEKKFNIKINNKKNLVTIPLYLYEIFVLFSPFFLVCSIHILN